MWRNWFFPAHGSYQEAEEENEQVEEGEEENKRTQTVHTSSLTHRHRRELIGPSTTTNGQGEGGGRENVSFSRRKFDSFVCVCVCFRQINKRENGHRLYSYNTQIFFFCLFHSFYEKKEKQISSKPPQLLPSNGPIRVDVCWVSWERSTTWFQREWGQQRQQKVWKIVGGLLEHAHTQVVEQIEERQSVGRCCRSFIGSDCVIKRQTTQNDFSWVKKRWRRH